MAVPFSACNSFVVYPGYLREKICNFFIASKQPNNPGGEGVEAYWARGDPGYWLMSQMLVK
jgi:hypothetical protein